MNRQYNKKSVTLLIQLLEHLLIIHHIKGNSYAYFNYKIDLCAIFLLSLHLYYHLNFLLLLLLFAFYEFEYENTK